MFVLLVRVSACRAYVAAKALMSVLVFVLSVSVSIRVSVSVFG